MRVLYFARAADAAGCRDEEWDVAGPLSLEDYWDEAIRRHPALAELRSKCRVAAGGSYVGMGELLDPGGEVAMIPPVSGG